MRKLILFLLSVFCLCNLAFAFAGGDGSEGNPYQISDVDELQNMNASLTSHYILINDIDASATNTWNGGEGFLPIGNNTEYFEGSFNGNYYTISDLYINSSLSNVGLFGWTVGANITNVTLQNASVIGDDNVACLIGKSSSTTTIVSRCIIEDGNVYGGNNIGGVFGYANEVHYAINCTSSADVVGDVYVGGFAGHGRGIFTNNYVTGNVTGNSRVAGFIGLTWDATLTNCYSNGYINTIGMYSGGLVGESVSSTAAYCYWDTETSNQSTSILGTGKTTAQMQTQSTFTGWDFSNTWVMVDYPEFPLWIFSGGVGSYESPYLITDIYELQNISQDLDAHYILSNDIDASDTLTWNGGEGFNPIDLNNGSFDGMGYNITGLYINRPTEDNTGLFGHTQNSSISNFNMINANVTGDYYTAIVAGLLYNTLIENVDVYGNVTGTGDVGSIGGLLRYGSSIYQGYSDTNVSSTSGTYSISGGIAGYLRDASSIEECASYGTLSISGQRNGGIVGQVTESSTVTNCYSDVDIIGGSYNGAGFGRIDLATIDKCYGSGNVGGSSSQGLIATSVSSAVTNSFWDINTTGQTTSSGGTGKTTAQMLQQSTYAGWDFSTIWQMEQYPIFQFESLDYTQNPIIGSPLNNTTYVTSYPETYNMQFIWGEHDGVSSSTYELAKDENYLTTVSSSTITSFTNTISLAADDYWFRVKYNYDDGSESEYSEVQFTINSTFADYGTAVQGVVYRTASGSLYPLNGVKVTAYSDEGNPTQDYITSENGFYLFDDIEVGNWTLVASKDGYETSSLNYITIIENNTTTKDIYLEEENAPTYILPHYVRFILTNYIYSYSDVDVAVYEGLSANAIYTGVTGDDGAIGFELSETTQYRITFIDATQGINRVWEGTPTDSQYYVIVFPDSIVPETREIDNILFGCYGQEINLSSGYINASFNDTSGTTTLAELWINDTNHTNLYYFNTTSSAYDWSQVVNASNSTYAVTFKIQNTALDEPLSITRTISFFQDVRVNLGFSEGWHYILIACAILAGLAMLFSRFNAVAGAIVTILSGWFVYFMGWLSAGMSTNQNITIGLMLLLGTLLAFGTAINSGERRD